jgi:RNA polymerase sigma-70 factor, ECF subfamily
VSMDLDKLTIESDASVIQRSLRHPEAFGEVFDRHWEAVHRYCRSRAGGDGEGLAAETFRLAFDRRAGYDSGRADALPWLLGLATNLIRNHLRRLSRGERAARRLDAGPAADHADAAIDRAEAELLGPALSEALDGIRAGERDILLLLAWNDLSYEEVAQALDIPVGTVRSRISRARLRLRARLAELGYARAEPVQRRL